jgi:arabinan endo-1,5-alpha-L-arabinosidase
MVPRGLNPVIAHDFADPMVLKAKDGYYYAYATQRHLAKGWINIQVARSKDMWHWQDMGDALPQKPKWASGSRNFWAPHVMVDGNRYVMYYSTDRNEKDGLCLAVATSQSPLGPFVTTGAPLAHGPSFINIDPFAFDDPKTGKKWLYWGSGFEPIRMQELSADRLSFKPGSSEAMVLWPSRDPYENLVEGAYLIERGGFYYLFYSGDDCCGNPAHYAVMVARATSPSGPFVKLNYETGAKDSTILHANAKWDGPGHNGIIRDDAGRDWIVYHAVDRQHRMDPITHDLVRKLMIDPLEYRNGWPVVPGGVPTP